MPASGELQVPRTDQAGQLHPARGVSCFLFLGDVMLFAEATPYCMEASEKLPAGRQASTQSDELTTIHDSHFTVYRQAYLAPQKR